MANSDNIAFYRTELRVLKNIAKDETEFLERVATMLNDLTEDCDEWKRRARIAEDRLRDYE